MKANMGTESADGIDAVAVEWLVRRDAGPWGAAEQARLEDWLNASTLNRVAFLRLELAWEEVARLKALGAGIPGDRPPPPGHWSLSPFFNGAAHLESAARKPPFSSASIARLSGGRRLAIAAAATLVLAAGISAYLAFAPKGDTFTTPVGGLATVPMADGSNVTLNTDSQIRVALSVAERHVELGRGEAFFEVSKDPRRPFVVWAGAKRVIAVGTKFSVRREGDDVEVVVTEGEVRVDGGTAGQGPSGGGSADVFLTPGSIARAGDAGVLVQRKTLPEAEEQLGWRQGVLMFRDQTLEAAIAEFNRYNMRKIVIQDPAIATLKIEGNFRATNVEAFVRLLESGFPVHATAQPDQIVLTAK